MILTLDTPYKPKINYYFSIKNENVEANYVVFHATVLLGLTSKSSTTFQEFVTNDFINEYLSIPNKESKDEYLSKHWLQHFIELDSVKDWANSEIQSYNESIAW